MLKQRLISGGLLGAVLLSIVIFAPQPLFAGAFAVLFALGAWEWARLTLGDSVLYKVLYLLAFVLIVALLWWGRDKALANTWLLVAAAFWLGVIFILHRYHRRDNPARRWQRRLSIVGLLVLPAAWVAFIELQKIHLGWVLYILMLCGLADSFAFLAGKLFGKHKLAPQLSPGKTIEGAIGGISSVLVFALLVGIFWQGFSSTQLAALVALSLVVGLISIEGDLFESLIKREAGQKDSGRILPGHGGILDRFDSHIAASPLFFLGLQWILN
jgi:phosphatidate cytidylyltransferase